MASRPKTTTGPREPSARLSGRDAVPVNPERTPGTRQAVREIVRRYRETFERLGR
jgi:hypothetical protein